MSHIILFPGESENTCGRDRFDSGTNGPLKFSLRFCFCLLRAHSSSSLIKPRVSTNDAPKRESRTRPVIDLLSEKPLSCASFDEVWTYKLRCPDIRKAFANAPDEHAFMTMFTCTSAAKLAQAVASSPYSHSPL